MSTAIKHVQMTATRDTNRGMGPFAELGTVVENRWRDHNYDEQLFPAIAATALIEQDLPGRVDPWEIVRWVHATPSLPRQMDLKGDFGDPPITVYTGPRFHIDVYYWLDATTNIHQHSFAGAFQVLLGSSVHSSYRFEKERELNSHFLIGKLQSADVSLLGKGDTRQINPGPEFIHSLFHLERPSATITVRTYGGEPIQYTYLKPYLAYDPFFTDASLIKKTQTVSLLLSMEHPEADKFIAESIDSSDFQTAYAMLEQAFDSLCHRALEEIVGRTTGVDRFQALLERARRKHGELTDVLLPVFEEKWRQSEVRECRARIPGEDHRFFLALLLNALDRRAMLNLVKKRFPQAEPVELVVGWVKELAATRIFGSPEPNVLRIGRFDDHHLFVFRGLLEGLSIREIEARAAAEPLSAEFQPAVASRAKHIKELPLFRCLFESEQIN